MVARLAVMGLFGPGGLGELHEFCVVRKNEFRGVFL